MSSQQEKIKNFIEFCQKYIKGKEKKEAQIFLDRLFQAFGYQGVLETGAVYEHPIKKGSKNGKTGFADLVWSERFLIEMKARGEDLQQHYDQAFNYWLRLVPHRPRYVILCNFDEFWIYDFNLQLDDPIYKLTLLELVEKYYLLMFMTEDSEVESPTPSEPYPVFNNYKLINILSGHSEKIKTLNFSPDGKILASGGNDKTIKLWQLDCNQNTTLIGHNNSGWFASINSLAFSPDGKILASASDDKTIKLWDLQTKQEITTLTGHLDKVYTVAFSPNGKLLASGSADKTVKIWDLKTKQEIVKLIEHTDSVLSVVFSCDGKQIFSAGDGNDKTIKIWSVKTGSLIQTLTGHSDWFGGILSLALAPGGDFLVSSSKDKTSKIWQKGDYQNRYTLTGHTNWVTTVSINPTGKYIASGSLDKTVKLWELKTGNLITTIPGEDEINCLAFSPEKKYLMAIAYNNLIKLISF